MTRQEHLLVCLAEECSEVIHVISKTLRFGPDEIWPVLDVTNVERLKVELNDLFAVVNLLEKEGLDLSIDASSMVSKQVKVEKYIRYAKKLGTIK